MKRKININAAKYKQVHGYTISSFKEKVIDRWMYPSEVLVNLFSRIPALLTYMQQIMSMRKGDKTN